MYVCDICEERLCKDCNFGNPCLDCPDYDRTKDECKSNGACASAREEKMNRTDFETDLDNSAKIYHSTMMGSAAS